jgi:hypothetical protein
MSFVRASHDEPIDRAVKLVLVVLLGAAVTLIAALPASAAGPTCAEMMGISNHGQHIVGDYVTGTGHDDLAWPTDPAGGQAIGGSGGAKEPGAPGIHQHGGGQAQPGASFCNPQANSPTGADLPRGKK